MPAGSLEVPVNPAVLRWARESSGWTVQEISKKLKVSGIAIQNWESGETNPTLKHLETLAKYLKRPLAAFLLPEPPREPPLPADFRLLPRKRIGLTKKTRLAIRRARRLQSASRKLMESLGYEVTPQIRSANLRDNPEEEAALERNRLGVGIDDQLRWRNAYDAFERWRTAVERQNILVFQAPMPVEDARGFSLSDEKPFAIVVNSSDAMHARIFTLFHEYAHLALQEPGICIPESAWNRANGSAQIEKWCNSFAGALVVPTDTLRNQVDPQIFTDSQEALDEFLLRFSRELKVSKQVVLRRLFDLNLLSQSRYWQEREKLQREEQRTRKVQGYARSPANRCLSERGRRFTSLVLEAKQRDFITYGDVADYLSIRLKHLGKVQALLAT